MPPISQKTPPFGPQCLQSVKDPSYIGPQCLQSVKRFLLYWSADHAQLFYSQVLDPLVYSSSLERFAHFRPILGQFYVIFIEFTHFLQLTNKINWKTQQIKWKLGRNKAGWGLNIFLETQSFIIN